MTAHHSLRLRRAVGGLLAVAIVALGTAPGLGQPPSSKTPSRDQQIAEIQEQIRLLNKKLEDLKVPPAAAGAASASVPAGSLPDAWAKALTWRSIGPANMGGRITAVSVYEADPTTYWIATASGGLLKTINNGITFEHQFDKEATVSVGDVCVAPSNADVVDVGTGENNPRNSVSYGDGVYKSTDGGKTWANVGLKKTYQIGKIVVHPKNPDIVYVGALGRLYGASEDRGLYKTSDGGKTWTKILYIDDKTGIIDVRMSPADPETVIVAAWERKRDEYDGFFGDDVKFDQYGPVVVHSKSGGLYKTSDGGKTFKKLTQGLPTGPAGRIGLDWYLKDPKVVYAIIDTEKSGTSSVPYLGVQGEDAKDGGAKLTAITANAPSTKAGLKASDVVTAVNGKAVKTYDDLVKELEARRAGDKIKLSVTRGEEKKEIEATLGMRPPQQEERQGGGGGGGGGRGGRGGRGGAGQGPPPMLLAGFVAEDAEGGFTVRRFFGEDAEKAGLKEGDLVVAVDGKPATGFRETFQELSEKKKAGDTITVTIKRDNDKKDIELTLAEPAFGGRGGGSARPFSSGLGGQRENSQDQQGKDGFETGGVFRSADAGETWTRINSLNPRPMYFSQIRVDPSDEKYLYALGVSIHRSEDAGKSFRTDRGRGVHADGHALWINPKDGRHMIIGCDGGFYVTYDRMVKWDHLNHLALGQFYHVAIDPRRPSKVYGGLQDNGSWGGPTQVLRAGGPINEDWIYVSGGDGFVCRVDPTDPDLVYFESQNGNMGRRNLRTGERASIRPRNPQGGPPYRFNWNTPFILSTANPSIFYCAGNYVFRSLKKGDDLRPVSPEITRSKKGTGTALAESPRNPEVLWAGTDDGMLWVTRDGGRNWTNVADNVLKAGLPGPRWVATIETSKAAEGRAYVVFDAHRSNDDEPYVFVTEDFGKNWKSLRANLPWGSTRCLREDVQNPNLLYLGTEFAAFASTNRGAHWTKISNNLPTVAVHEFAQHPTSGEMVAATHGRSFWVLDVTPLRQVTQDVLTAQAALLQSASAVRWRQEPSFPYSASDRRFVGTNPPTGAQIYFTLAKKADKISLKVVDYAGKTVRELTPPNAPGLQRTSWNLIRSTQRQPAPGQESEGGFGGFGGGGGGFGMFGGGPIAPPGMYRVVLTVDGKEFSQPLRLEADPTRPVDAIAADGPDDDESAEEEREKEATPIPPRRVDD